MKKEKYYINDNGEFVIENFNLAKPFASFFPGIAGVWGKPLWVFYVNRGQAIATFGTKDKENPILEFYPANKAYYLTATHGFRTLIKAHSNAKARFYDAFCDNAGSSEYAIENRIVISPHELKLAEINRTLGIEVGIEYFTIPNDDYAALARKVSIKNTSGKNIKLELLDGLPQIMPYGMNNFFIKQMSRTIEAWMEVENLDKKCAFLRLRTDAADVSEVVYIKKGNFYLAFDEKGLIRPIVDPATVFGEAGNFGYPRPFLENRDFSYPDNQLSQNKTPCCFALVKRTLRPNEEYAVYSLIGNMDSLDKLNKNTKRIAQSSYFIKKQKENAELINTLTQGAFTHSSSVNFDIYCRQNFLDNLMRGGYPVNIAGTCLHLFSRKHGDLERDYNNFSLEPACLSQGNGSYRDVNQNRRNDVFFEPKIGEENILTFFNLIQADGYNPLVIKPDTFIFKGSAAMLRRYFAQKDTPAVKKFFDKPFTPGELFLFLDQAAIKLKADREEFLQALFAYCERCAQAEQPDWEGFWIDHWHYCLDLLESYLKVYPENSKEILIGKKDFTFFDNSKIIRPRRERYLLKKGRVYQYNSTVKIEEKDRANRKPVYKTTLIAKMLTVIANKFASLDAFGVGVEMEADKPSWADSLNGLPGLIGSSTSETFELKRWILFVKEKLGKMGLPASSGFDLPAQTCAFLIALEKICETKKNPFLFWDAANAVKEEYRKKVLMGFSGEERHIQLNTLNHIFELFLAKIDQGLKKAYNKQNGLPHPYFINEISKYKIAKNNQITALEFRHSPLPLFLESIMHSLRIASDRRQAKKIYNSVRKSELFDRKLKMYKLCASLKKMPLEIGRSRVFTPGWLENESIWLHMEYKYLLEVLKNGLYEEFYRDFKCALVPFQKPQRYGRSIFENSSFIVSSAFPQKALHGNGFVARLSGVTAEFINIWLIMCLGNNPFYIADDGKLRFEPKPVLPGWLFTTKKEKGFEKNTFAFKFLSKTLIVYQNPSRKDTFAGSGACIKKITVTPTKGERVFLSTAYIPEPYSGDIREGKIKRIDIAL
ncbi:MAG: hypothetical protein V2A72_07615 [Candidatus Omnitrophota bacterium]